MKNPTAGFPGGDESLLRSSEEARPPGGHGRPQLPWHFVFSPYDSEADTKQVATERLKANVSAH